MQGSSLRNSQITGQMLDDRLVLMGCNSNRVLTQNMEIKFYNPVAKMSLFGKEDTNLDINESIRN